MSIEEHRAKAMKAIVSTTTWAACWPLWKKEILLRTDGLTNAARIYHLGSQLREIFFKTTTGARTQSAVSGAGMAWECLVCWYLNLVLSGTRGVAMRQSRQLVPTCLLDATTMTYGSYQTNTESDLCVIVYPAGFPYPGAGRGYKAALDVAVAKAFGDIELGIVQCKANWNDNAQIPMLWDMVYRASFDKGTNIKLGRNGYSVKHLKAFTYSFVTTPTQKSAFKSTSMPVKRTNNLSGGNFWGQPTSSGVALSVSEIFVRNFGSAFDSDVVTSIEKAIVVKNGLFAGVGP
ncbi:hypothetical protein [Agrobacterium sp. RAC06]|uniref:hypothetical protein n=1 Tax=Agrobacterium sp. RAC06 TaxID=1842536 RepID=UPI00083DA805|nr:hypothetical protein [Agrobacterium sp. RAC06]AOG12172.1 hypothetical protein BSY240_2282 [Agrobacterium sp. RAC06]